MTDAYTLVGFEEAFADWVAREQPSRELQLLVFGWICSRYDDPYQGVRRGQAVQCAYFIHERDHSVQFDSFSTLSEPL